MEVLSIVLLNGFMFYKLCLIYCVKGSKKLLFLQPKDFEMSGKCFKRLYYQDQSRSTGIAKEEVSWRMRSSTNELLDRLSWVSIHYWFCVCVCVCVCVCF